MKPQKKMKFVDQLEMLKKQKEEDTKRLRELGVRPDETYIYFLYRTHKEKQQ